MSHSLLTAALGYSVLGLSTQALANEEPADQVSLEQQYQTGRALGITGTIGQIVYPVLPSALLQLGSPTSSKDEEGNKEWTPPNKSILAGALVTSFAGNVGFPLMTHLGALQSSNALDSLGGQGSPVLSYVALGLEGGAALMSLTAHATALSSADSVEAFQNNQPVFVGFQTAKAVFSFSAWITGIVHIDRNHRRFNGLHAETSDDGSDDGSQRLTPWDLGLSPRVTVHRFSLPNGGHVELSAGGGLGVAGHF